MGYFTLFQKVVHYTCTFNVYKHLKIRLTARMIFSGKRIHCSELLLAVINMVLQIAGLYPFPRASARGNKNKEQNRALAQKTRNIGFVAAIYKHERQKDF